ncbi:MAG: DNA-binding protein Alba [Candidatus Bathyarchaeia archaeon]
MASASTNSIFVGRKPVMNYVLACITLLQGGAPEVSVKARGRAINRAVDVVEVVRKRFMPDVKVKDVKIGTEQLVSKETNAPMNVSTIEIILSK